jgi:hypothetical protein
VTTCWAVVCAEDGVMRCAELNIKVMELARQRVWVGIIVICRQKDEGLN